MKFKDVLKKRGIVTMIVGLGIAIASAYGLEAFPGMNTIIVEGICQVMTCTP